MTAPSPHGRLTPRLARIALAVACALLLSPPTISASPRHAAPPTLRPAADTPYDHALRLREALQGRPEAQRTRRDYDRALDAFRSVYHANPHDPRADASVAAVAELLAEQGRLFEDRKSSLDAIGEYEFLRRAYPRSPRRQSALLTEGEIYRRDLDDTADSRQAFASFLRLYPRSPLAEEAREGLRATPATIPAPAPRRNTVLTAALGSRAALPARSPAHPPKPNATAQANSQAALASLGPSYPHRSSPSPRPSSAQPVSPPLGRSPGDTLVERDLDAPLTSSNTTSPAPATGKEPPPAPLRTEAALNATPPAPRRGRLPLVTGVRHWSTSVYTRVAIDLEDEVKYEASRAPNPDRIFFDLHGARLSPELIGKAVTVTDGGYLKRIRVAQFSNDVVRIVLDVSDVSDYSAFLLPNPYRLIIDIHGNAHPGAPSLAAANQSPPPTPRTTPSPTTITQSAHRSATTTASALPSPTRNQAPPLRAQATTQATLQSSALSDIDSLDRQPNTIRATRQPTTAPVSVSVAGTAPAPQPSAMPAPPSEPRRPSARLARGLPPADTAAPAIHAPDIAPGPTRAAALTAAGERSMVRALGLKIGRIVVDAGHGGHDSGTLGPGGIEEKDVVLDVALRLGKLLKQRLGADVIYTRDDDTFIPLETRTAIANKAQADLFISVHANSSPDASARGVETYYLNFTTSADALEVAARENAVSDQSIHQLSDLVKKITLQDKIAESREFAGDVEQTLYSGLEAGNLGLKDRGVKKAPFVVLIGANMPSILAEISFLTNPDDAHQLRDPEYRQRIAESLYRGVAKYIGSLSGVRLAQGASGPTGQ